MVRIYCIFLIFVAQISIRYCEIIISSQRYMNENFEYVKRLVSLVEFYYHEIE